MTSAEIAISSFLRVDFRNIYWVAVFLGAGAGRRGGGLLA